ncbi:hypothetical protein I547_4635 [Mycobacterium kansasii 824]|nr:hypothetical protein I547_4635 [Mycobacterium kansasii 824]
MTAAAASSWSCRHAAAACLITCGSTSWVMSHPVISSNSSLW